MATDKRDANLAYFKRLGTPIVSPATAPGGPVGVLRLSGRDLSPFSSLLGPLPEAGRFVFRPLTFLRGDKVLGDEVLLLSFKAPNSFTGEDVLEIQGHGIPSLMEGIQMELERVGALRALPGEFSFRAVLNSKMTLEKAEALQAAFALEGLGASDATKLLQVGASSEASVTRRLELTLESIDTARGRLEAAIDFPEAESEQAADVEAALAKVSDASARLTSLISTFEIFSKASHIPRVVICGRPNVGKSTLLNALAGGNRALVSPLAGTTRDIVEIRLRLPSGRELRLLDTAGLRELSSAELSNPDRQLEAHGIELAHEALELADLVIWVSRATSWEPIPDFLKIRPNLELASYGDVRTDGGKLAVKTYNFKELSNSSLVFSLLNDLDEALSSDNSHSGEPIISKRQLGLLQAALSSLAQARESLVGHRPMELGADDLREADTKIREALGQGLTDDYIGAIFSQFCLGK